VVKLLERPILEWHATRYLFCMQVIIKEPWGANLHKKTKGSAGMRTAVPLVMLLQEDQSSFEAFFLSCPETNL
jgi:hypothetical protein